MRPQKVGLLGVALAIASCKASVARRDAMLPNDRGDAAIVPGGAEHEVAFEPERRPAGDTWSFLALLAPKRLRNVSFAEDVIDIAVVGYGLDFFVSGAGFDPLHDFDAIAFASDDARDWRTTILMVQSVLDPAELEAGIDRAAATTGETIEWSEGNNGRMGNPRPSDPTVPDSDPRWFLVLRDGTVVYALPELLTSVVSEELGPITLAGLRRHLDADAAFGGFLAAEGFTALMPGNDFPLPDRVQMVVEADSAPQFVWAGEFSSVAVADGYVSWWRDGVPRFVGESLPRKLMFGPLLETVVIERDAHTVRMSARLTPGQMEFLLSLLEASLARTLRASPEDRERARQRRLERWEARGQGRLPPSAIVQPVRGPE